jgi:hypothetical protein
MVSGGVREGWSGLDDFLVSASMALQASGLEPRITEPGPELGVEVETPGRLYAIRVPSPGPYPLEVWVGLTVAAPSVFSALREREEIVTTALGEGRLGWNPHPDGGGWLGLCLQIATCPSDLGPEEGRTAASRLLSLHALVENGRWGEQRQITTTRRPRLRLTT